MPQSLAVWLWVAPSLLGLLHAFEQSEFDTLLERSNAGDFGDKDGTVGIDELMHFARYAVLERSEGRQKPTFPRVEGGENFPLARARGSGEAR